ncbi:MAG: hypothetical protein AAFR88_07705 [Pseudomonadota bacterium]
MLLDLSFALAAVLGMQAADAAPAPSSEQPAIASLSDLPIEEATGPRCGIAFSIVREWQSSSDPRGAKWPVMDETGAREFFVQAMAKLIDQYGLERSEVSNLARLEAQAHAKDKGAAVEAMMPACLLALQASGL